MVDTNTLNRKIYLVTDCYDIEEDVADSVFTNKKQAIERADYLIDMEESYAVWVDVMTVNQPLIARKRIYTRKFKENLND